MQKITLFIYFSLMIILQPTGLLADEPVLPVWLIRNWENPDTAEAGVFRTLQDDFHREQSAGALASRNGLSSLRASGSAQVSEKNLQWLKEKLRNHKLTIVDLRQESHGFLNGLPISWYMGEDQINRGKTLSEIEEDERLRLGELSLKTEVWVYRLVGSQGTDADLIKVNDAITEKQLCTDLELYYIRIPVADFQRPADKEVDEFIDLVRNMDKDSWLHIHCAAGQGRTTTFLAMFDMMHNAKYVSLEDIVKRQCLLGGIDLLSVPTREAWDNAYARERADFIRHFYQYCQNNDDDFKHSWSAWLKEMEGRL